MDNITPAQQQLLDELREADPDLITHWDEARGVAGSIRGALTEGGGEDTFMSFAEQYGVLFGLSGQSPLESLELLSRREDDIGWSHLDYFHAYPVEGYGPVEVYGAKLAAHIDHDGVLIEVQSSLWRDLAVDGQVVIEPDEFDRRMLDRISRLDRFAELRDEAKAQELDFPMSEAPRLVVYPWENRFPVAWVSYGYSDLDVDQRGEPTRRSIDYGQVFVDATTGERILFAPTLQTAETATTGTGLAVTPITGTRTTRTLEVVRIDNGNTYRLKNTKQKRDIVTYDAGCSTSFNSNGEIGAGITGNTLSVSSDTDGDHDWDREPTSTSSAQRTSAQMPEVDAHHFMERQYLWYKALGRTGWDDNDYSDPPVPDQTLNVVAHCHPPDDWGLDCRTFNAYKWSRKAGGKWTYWLAFMDGDGMAWDYASGSHFIFAHEYQHAITDFSFKDGSGNPGLMYSGWKGAVHEGLSDTFGILATEQWLPCREVSHSSPAQIFRNLVYPRDTAAFDPNMLDHFADRNTTSGFYPRGTILGHCAYLMGKGGLHQRATRSPVLIPVPSLGRATVGGINMPKAARIWYRAINQYCSTIGSATGGGDEGTFRTIRNACVSAASDLYGTNSAEYRNTILAFYAVGLHPETYGADVTFLRWGISWDLSRSYVGMSCPNYGSLDLFVNNGGASEWNAQINVVDGTGTATDFENDVYCRVRNVGDQTAQNVEVDFHYAKAGTATINWLPVTDKNGTVQKLTVGSLAAGQSNFADSAQNSPPASAGVKWHIPPLPASETVDHYCLRATVKASNDANDFNNVVQSNIAYVAYSAPTPSTTAFIVGNPDQELELEADVRMEHTLPASWQAMIREDLTGVMLQPLEERVVHVSIEPATGADSLLEAPLNGELRGRMTGHFRGSFTGTLTDTHLRGDRLEGTFAGSVRGAAPITGHFSGTVDLTTAEVRGAVLADHPATRAVERLELQIRGCLRPWRRVEMSQWRDDELIGGMTVQIQVPWGDPRCAYQLPPTRTRVETTPIIDRRNRWRIPLVLDNTVGLFLPDGERLSRWELDGSAAGVAVDPAGNTYVTQPRRRRVQRFSPEGELVAEWDAEGQPYGVACLGEELVLVTVPRRGRVQAFTPDGDLVGGFSVEGNPRNIAVDLEGNCYVSAMAGRFMFRYTLDGRLVSEWRVREGIVEPNGIAVIGDGELVAVAGRRRSLRVLTPEGDAVSRWEVDGRPHSLSSRGNELAVGLDDNSRVAVIGAEGEIVDEWPTL